MPISATDRTPSPASDAYHRTSSLYDIDRRTNAYISDRPRPTRARPARARVDRRDRAIDDASIARGDRTSTRGSRARARDRGSIDARPSRVAHDDVDDDDDDDDDARGATRRETRARERRARATRARARRRRRRGASAARDAGWRLRRGTRGEDR